jgi:predicted Zn-dependent protease
MLALAPMRTEDGEFRTYRAYGRGEALLRRGDAGGVRREIAALRAETDGGAEATIALGVLEGRLAMAQGRARDAIGHFASAAEVQDSRLRGYMDPPTWWYPVRRSLAAAYLKAGDARAAEAEALAALGAWKNDPLALFVLSEAQGRLGRVEDSASNRAQARALWRGDFDSITLEAI